MFIRNVRQLAARPGGARGNRRPWRDGLDDNQPPFVCFITHIPDALPGARAEAELPADLQTEAEGDGQP